MITEHQEKAKFQLSSPHVCHGEGGSSSGVQRSTGSREKYRHCFLTRLVLPLFDISAHLSSISSDNRLGLRLICLLNGEGNTPQVFWQSSCYRYHTESDFSSLQQRASTAQRGKKTYYLF